MLCALLKNDLSCRRSSVQQYKVGHQSLVGGRGRGGEVALGRQCQPERVEKAHQRRPALRCEVLQRPEGLDACLRRQQSTEGVDQGQGDGGLDDLQKARHEIPKVGRVEQPGRPHGTEDPSCLSPGSQQQQKPLFKTVHGAEITRQNYVDMVVGIAEGFGGQLAAACIDDSEDFGEVLRSRTLG